MFQGFTKETSDFLWELSFNNERPWFLEHKNEFERVLNTPFRELAKDTFSLFSERHPELNAKLHTARIYRDARRLFGRGPYKDHLWFSMKDGTMLLEGPMFWFEIGAAEFSYGMGFYSATPAQMQRFRDIADAEPAALERIIDMAEGCPEYVLSGEKYSRPKGVHDERFDNWYNRRQLGLEHTEDFGGAILEPSLPGLLTDEFEKLLPIYEFFMRFYI